MQKLADIILKKGDIVYYGDNETIIVNGYDGKTVNKLQREILGREEITKIERPHYETIYETSKEILTKEEKEYLENFLRPFRNRIIKIEKRITEENSQCIHIIGKSSKDNVWLPSFKANTMYKGMELDKEYTLEELGLFKE